jgi:hypothetical protein
VKKKPTAGVAEEAEYTHRAVRIDPLDLREEYMRLPGDLATANARYAEALDAYLEAEAHAKSETAKLYLQLRELMAIKGDRVTEAMLLATLESSPKWLEIRGRVVSAEVDKVRARGLCDAIHAKREMLVSLGAHVRKEMDNDPTIRKQYQDRNE